MSSNELGIIFKSTGSWYRVRMADGSYLDCRIRGKIKLDDHKTTNPVTVGDLVKVSVDPNNPGTGIIGEIMPRANMVIRKSVHKTEHGHLLAANIDQAFLIVTLNHPKTSFGFIDRFLVSTEAYAIPSILLINKMDLHAGKDANLLDEIRFTYENIGVATHTVSFKTKENLSQIISLLADKTSLIAGHSGTGKSTFMNSLNPSISQKVGAVSEFANKGIHTTTFAEMFEIANNTYVIDTPGIKELGLIDIGDHELADYFPEMRALLGQCKFHNCSHTHEPKCAVIAAFERGEIALSRYHSYLSMLENEDSRR